MAGSNELVFVPLGGIGEIGMNMAAYGFGPRHDRKWIVVDCGVTFAGPDLPGIDLIMADPAFLEEQGKNVLALVLTHSHEDHYGAVLELWSDFDLPVYAGAFTAAMLSAKRISNGYTDNLPVRLFEPGKPFQIGPFKIEAINMAHSIPESFALLIETEIGRALHTGDWKIDTNPIVGPPTDIARLKKIGQEGSPLALVSDSTNAMKEGESPSERDVAKTLEKLIAEAPNRVAVTTFASNVGRIISIARAGQKAGRQVVISGRALHRVTAIAREMGMLDDLEPFFDHDVFGQLPRKKTLLICTGSQGEPRASVAKISKGEHPAIDLDPGDLMIFSSWAIPGNEKAVIQNQNDFVDRGVRIITNADKLVHVSGHPRRGEMSQLYDWVKPDVLVPAHGEAMHLEAHAALGRELGIEKVISARNGDMVRLLPNARHFPGEVGTGTLYLDGEILCTPEESGVRGRRRLSFGGLIAVSFCVDDKGNLISDPEVEAEGIPLLEGDEDFVIDLVEKTTRSVLKSIPPKRRNNPDKLADAVRGAVRGEVGAHWGRRPNVMVFVHTV